MAEVPVVEGRVRGLGDEDAALPPPQARQVHELLVALAARTQRRTLSREEVPAARLFYSSSAPVAWRDELAGFDAFEAESAEVLIVLVRRHRRQEAAE